MKRQQTVMFGTAYRIWQITCTGIGPVLFRIWTMACRQAQISVVLVAMVLGAAPALAETLGKMEITIAGRKQTLKIDDSSAGVDTFWAVGPVSILVQGNKGGTIQIGFDEEGVGLARGGYMIVTSADGSIWQDVDGSFSVTVTRADNVPPRFSVAGQFEGVIEYNGITHPVTGRFDVLLPRQNFAPTPPPNP